MRIAENNDVFVCLGAELSACGVDRLRRWYQRITAAMAQTIVPANNIAIHAPSQPKGYRDLSRTRKRIEAADWSAFRSVSLRCMPQDRRATNSFLAGCSEAGLAQTWTEYTPPRFVGRWASRWTVCLNDTDCSEANILQHQLGLAGEFVDDYGYLYFMRRHKGPDVYFIGLSVGGIGPHDPGDGRTNEQVQNVSGWRSAHAKFEHRLLRDIYPYSFLNRRYLDRPVFDTTLEKWILADAARGTLEPLTSTVTMWRPIVESIPAIREELYRAGAMYYYRHFDTADPMFRDFTKPWQRPKDVPEIFSETSYTGQDPQLTL